MGLGHLTSASGAAGGLSPSHASRPCVEYSPAFSAIDGAPREDRTMTDERIIEVKPEIAARAHVNAEQYRAMYAEAQSDPDGYWANEARRIPWIKPPSRIKNTSFTGDLSIRWFEDGTLNASSCCLDRHL